MLLGEDRISSHASHLKRWMIFVYQMSDHEAAKILDEKKAKHFNIICGRDWSSAAW